MVAVEQVHTAVEVPVETWRALPADRSALDVHHGRRGLVPAPPALLGKPVGEVQNSVSRPRLIEWMKTCCCDLIIRPKHLRFWTNCSPAVLI